MDDEMEYGESGYVATENGIREKSTGIEYSWEELEELYGRKQDSDSTTED